jgi:hypothetical protein
MSKGKIWTHRNTTIASESLLSGDGIHESTTCLTTYSFANVACSQHVPGLTQFEVGASSLSYFVSAFCQGSGTYQGQSRCTFCFGMGLFLRPGLIWPGLFMRVQAGGYLIPNIVIAIRPGFIDRTVFEIYLKAV